jgi:hypothetical protein
MSGMETSQPSEAPIAAAHVIDRLALAQNPDTETQELWQLIDDPNTTVANTARHRLNLALRPVEPAHRGHRPEDRSGGQAVSGGSFNYLCSRYSLTELLEQTSDIDTMGRTLRNAGHVEAAAATESILADIKAFEESILARGEALRGVWKAVEWTHSSDWGPGSITREVEAFNARPTV